jgi:hypothetical protein
MASTPFSVCAVEEAANGCGGLMMVVMVVVVHSSGCPGSSGASSSSKFPSFALERHGQTVPKGGG